jgi:hypothetical protein
MWIFTLDGFYSVVTAEEFGCELQVRARSVDDPDRLRAESFPEVGVNVPKPGRHYPDGYSPAVGIWPSGAAGWPGQSTMGTSRMRGTVAWGMGGLVSTWMSGGTACRYSGRPGVP